VADERRRFGRAIRTVLLATCAVVAVFSSAIWLAQLRGPIYLCKGPVFRDTTWEITRDIPGGPGWGMSDPTGVQDVYLAGYSIPCSAIEVPQAEAPPMDGTEPFWNSMLVGVGFGYLHVGQAQLSSVPAPSPPPASGMVYVSPTHIAIAIIPLWPMVVLFAIWPTVALVRGPVRRWRRGRRGLCITCGYNLTGNVSGRCPECATPTDTSPERERRVTTAQPSVVDSGDRDQASAG